MAKLLVAEDESALRMLIVDTLEDEGHDVDVAADGAEAVAFIENNEYDLVVLDNMMPRLTGLEVIAKVRGMAHKKHLKILMLSAKNQLAEREGVMEVGADEFMPKPFSPIQLARRVGEMVHD